MEFFLGAFAEEWQRRKAAFLHEQALGRGKRLDDEERRRRGGSVPIAPSVGRAGGSRNGASHAAGAFSRGRGWVPASEPSMRSRFTALASGSQPAVVKMASFGGGSRLGAMINYVSRNGKVAVENERGEQMTGRDELSAVRGEWDRLMKNRAESRDIGTFVIGLQEPFGPDADVYEQARDVLKRGFGDRSFAFAVTVASDGERRIEGVVVLRDSKGERLAADKKATEIVQVRLDGDGSDRDGRAVIRFTGYGNGTDYGAARLRDLFQRHDGAVRDEMGRAIDSENQASQLVQLEWRNQLHSRKPRDVMHVVLSARAGTDVQAFHAAARDFLAEQFAGHRYVFSMHDPSQDPRTEEAGGKRPHVHVHAIVAMGSEAGDRIETTIPAFRRWRVTMAQKAREHGINMEMTDRRERASAAAYSRNQVRPTNRTGRTEHEGTSETAQRRYDQKRSDGASFAKTEDSRVYSESARREWSLIATSDRQTEVRHFAERQEKRLDSEILRDNVAQQDLEKSENSSSQYRTNLVTLMEAFSGDEEMRQMTRQEFEAYEQRVETALFQAERIMPEAERSNFEEIVSAAREHVNVRRELMELQEQNSEQHVREDQTERGAAGNSLIREIAEVDEELRVAIEVAERSRERGGKSGQGGDTEPQSRIDIEFVNAHQGEPDRSSRDAFENQSGGDDRQLRQERTSSRAGDTTRSDPAQQHVPRLDQLQREAEERRERDQDDRDG